MTATRTRTIHTLSTSHRETAHIIVRIATKMKLQIAYRCNKETHKVEFQVQATPKQFASFTNRVAKSAKK